MQETRCAVQTQGWAVGSWEHRVPNSPCIQMSGNHSKSECQHHSGSPISYHPMNAILCLSALCEQCSTSLFPGTAAPLQHPRMTSQAQVLRQVGALSPQHAQDGELKGTLPNLPRLKEPTQTTLPALARLWHQSGGGRESYNFSRQVQESVGP